MADPDALAGRQPPATPPAAAGKKRRGPKLTTGRFETREELVEAVWRDYLKTQRNQSQIARAYRVSQGVVGSILSAPCPDSVAADSAAS